MVEKIGQIRISFDDVDTIAGMIVKFNQGNMNEDELTYAVIIYILNHINVEII